MKENSDLKNIEKHQKLLDLFEKCIHEITIDDGYLFNYINENIHTIFNS